MTADDEARARQQQANLARHLSESYPDTVLFLARYAAGRDVIEATVMSVGPDEVVFKVRVSAEGAETLVAVALPEDDDGVRARLRLLVELARRAAPDEPLTALERRHPGDGHGERGGKPTA